uniref:Uncharacterized protein n=1 Tax=Rhizophora mucronata TaxID=61149 RepID=A0A2P2P104_RHIMU
MHISFTIPSTATVTGCHFSSLTARASTRSHPTPVSFSTLQLARVSLFLIPCSSTSPNWVPRMKFYLYSSACFVVAM